MKIVPVEMKGVFAWVVIIEHYIDNLVLLKNESVGVGGVDGCVIGCEASGEGGVKGWDFGAGVGYSIEGGAE